MNITSISRSRWLHLLKQLPFYPPFYSPTWLETYQKLKKGYHADAFEINCTDGTYLFPYLLSKVLVFKFIYSNPLSTYGGPILVSGVHDAECVRMALDYLARRYTGILINFDPFNRVGEQDFPGFKVYRGFTHVIDTRGEFDFPETFKRGIKKAKRAGVEVVVNEFLKNFLLEIFKKGWLDRRLQGQSFFFEDLIIRGCGKLYSAVYQGKPVAHIFVLFGKNYAFYHYGVSKREYLSLRPNNLLHSMVIDDLGNGIYNLGSSMGLPGVEEFKRRMGAKRVPVVSIYRGFIRKKPF